VHCFMISNSFNHTHPIDSKIWIDQLINNLHNKDIFMKTESYSFSRNFALKEKYLYCMYNYQLITVEFPFFSEPKSCATLWHFSHQSWGNTRLQPNVVVLFEKNLYTAKNIIISWRKWTKPEIHSFVRKNLCMLCLWKAPKGSGNKFEPFNTKLLNCYYV